MDLTAIIKAVSAPLETRSLGDWLQDLQPGDKLTGRVLSAESDGRVLVDLGRSRVLAQIAFAVRPGQSLRLQVVETGPVLHFRALDPQGEPIYPPVSRADFMQVLTKNQQEQFVHLADRLMEPPEGRLEQEIMPREVLYALSQVKTLFEGVPMQRPVDQIALWIKRAVEDRGIWFEKRLADMVSKMSQKSMEGRPAEGSPAVTTALITRDIKPQLILLKNFLADTGDQPAAVLKLAPNEIDFLRHCVDRLLGHVDQQQERAVARWETGETQQVMVHLWPLQEQHAPVELKLYYPQKKGGGEGPRQHHIALLLNMDRLGPLRVDLAMIDGHLHISFFVGSEALRAHFQNEIQSVEDALAETFQQLRVDIFVSQEKIAQFHGEDLKGAAPGRVDIKA